MPRSRRWRAPTAALIAAALAAGTVYALTRQDPGRAYEHSLAAQSKPLFGFGHPLAGGATGSTNAPGAAAVEAAAGLQVSLVSHTVGEDADMIALWPDDSAPT